METLLSLFVVIAALVIAIWFYILIPSQMATSRGRSPVFWVLVSLVLSPFVSIILLALLGNANEA